MPKKGVDLKKSVSSTQVEVLPVNPLRSYALLVNDGATDIYLGMGIPAELNRGIRLNSAGGSYEINLSNPWHGSISAISTGTPDILIQEW